jgi:dTDP-4-dehydrorhamnose 3,5-epimerase
MAIEIQIPNCEKGLGDLIFKPDAATLIHGVQVEPYSIFPDDRGCFMEIGRLTRDLLAEFPAESTQVSAAVSYPGTIKAFHFHKHQTDYWVPATGMFQVALVDLRPDSKSFGARNTFYVGTMRPWRILIPPGVGHGYKIVSQDAAMLVYVTNRFYDPDDEGRIPYNDPHINYDWDTQHK